MFRNTQCYVTLERVLGIDLKEIENRILTDEIKEQYKIVGSGRFSINDEFRALIRDNIVVTITDNDNKKIERKKYDNNRRTEK